jgi:DNA-binding response OmpR family regulator
MLVVGAHDDSVAVRYTALARMSRCRRRARTCWSRPGWRRWCGRPAQSQARILWVGSLTVDRDVRTADMDGRAATLTRLEFDLLATLAS